MAYEVQETRARILDIVSRGFATENADAMLKIAKELETWVWQGMAPAAKAATPLNTVEEIADILNMKLHEYAAATDPVTCKKILDAFDHFQRFLADINVALKGAAIG